MPRGLLDGIPVGIIMFAGTVLAFLWRKYGRKRAVEDLPALAQELGLEFSPSRYANSQGRMKGRYQGYEVRVDPEDTRVIAVRFEHPPEVDLRTYEHSTRGRVGWTTVFSGDREFDRFFKTRFASEDLAQALSKLDRPSQYLAPFSGEYARQLESLTVTSEGVTCKLNFGNPPYIPAAAIRLLLPACVALATWVDTTAAGSGVEPESRNGVSTAAKVST